MPSTPSFDAPYAEADEAIAGRLLAEAGLPAAAEARIDARARQLIDAIRARSGGLGGIEDFLREYSLTTKEGLALMVLAEALLRVPDSRTADALIEDKLSGTDWAHRATKSEAWLVSASAWALGVTARVIHPGETPEGILETIGKRLGLPTVRAATRQAMRLLGSHFVLGQTISEALGRAGAARRFRYSYDMLGEGARTAADAARYFASYRDAIEAIGKTAGNETLPNRPGISVKLSALHPRYEAVSAKRVMAELVPQVLKLAEAAKAHDLNFTIDAEEADRLELSLEVIEAVLASPSLAGWDGFGLAIQAYQKRALAVIEWLERIAVRHDRKLMVRLVKGAYWDTEVKRAQERGLPDFPVFTRKPMTDLNYMACARRLLAARPRLYPQFATHNALTIATILEEAGNAEGFEFQRLHGMGEALYDSLLADLPLAACRTYAPVGGHRDLLAYLVRRLLENGANSSFVSASADPAVPVEALLTRPQSWIGAAADARPRRLPLPKDLYAPSRINSAGVEFGDREALSTFRTEIAAGVARAPASARPLVGGKAMAGAARPVTSPVDGSAAGTVDEADAAIVASAFATAEQGFRRWSRTPVSRRAEVLETLGDRLEAERGMLSHLLAREAGKTLDDAVAEIREAVDFCRYYAAEARRHFGEGQLMPGPTGEENRLTLRGRGTIVCISPWNFPLAIFLGQVAAALAAGNAVIAKPAEQTPLIAAAAVKLAHEAGVPAEALALVPGDGRVGALLTADPRVAGIAFTGSTEVAWIINKALAGKRGPIVPLIAETGGINAMIVDATALPEQVSDDVVTSAFRSAGQRCSALRLLCLQEDIADRMLEMIRGAAAELKIGDPADPAVHVGPVIDAEAKEKLDAVVARARAEGRLVWQAALPADAPRGLFVPPAIVRVTRAEDLTEEVFGPVLHVTTWKAGSLPQLLDAIAGNGTGLTLGVHSRIDAVAEQVIERLANGNVYVNRNMIGAVVGTQPFGGSALSGTGPKAGGPHYLPRFALEQVVSVNTAAAGGNASLLAGGEG
ncbi:MAG: bifunctional proline dehydrogenase/L-glutamate gamma-semialdehyde dehydrogenase PutA [Proteobacteria bacterium]|nr:bifunctional proline dehydrogenase/L-glutamate gamma-semialdehyde dehydrogenase PutA [Pseudomonadota bacterium]